MSLKKQVKEVKGELMKREEELLGLKKNVKTTRIQELESENSLYKDELIRLRYMLETGEFLSQQKLGSQASGGDKLHTATSCSEATTKTVDGNSIMQAQSTTSHEFGST